MKGVSTWKGRDAALWFARARKRRATVRVAVVLLIPLANARFLRALPKAVNEGGFDMICPFCGRESQSEEHCTKCYALFNKEVRRIACDSENDPRSDMIGPFTSKQAKILAWTIMGLLIVAFVAATELTGNGLSGH